MRTEIVPTAERATEQARRAAERAAVDVRLLDRPDEFVGAAEVFNSVWGTGPADSQMPAGLTRALTHSGGYAAGAFDQGELVGAVVGFLGLPEDLPEKLQGSGVYLHSHILGVVPSRQARHVGYALKQHQRAWALERGLDRITWTFDPLVRRNAHFNFQKLGADAAAYLVNFYGSMTDGINGGDESDRLLVEWRLGEPRADAAAEHQLFEPAIDGEGISVAVTADGERTKEPWEATVVCATPADVIALRRDDPEHAKRWRRAVRSAFEAALGDGYGVTGFTRGGWYVLERAA